jgi:broad specificity phosphatase PhoE
VAALVNLDLVTSAPRGEPFITLVRHGETDWNNTRTIQGQTNEVPLNSAGREQVRVVARSLREMGFDQIVSSDLQRAMESALIIGEALALVPTSDSLLRERCFGEYEGRQYDESTNDITGIKGDAYVNLDARPPGGESFREVIERARCFIKRADEEWPGQRVLAVTHGGMIQALRAVSSHQPLEGTPWYRVGNCSVWTL